MRRKASLILLALAVFFTALSPLLRWYAFPGMLLLHLPVFALIQWITGWHLFWGGVAGATLYFLGYEYTHYLMHVPRGHYVERFRWFRFLREHQVSLVVADLPPLGIAAANAAGIAAIALGNFTWDWIYEHYDGGASVAARIAEVYRGVTLALRLPMWGGFKSMPLVRDLPFVARHSTRDRDQVRDALGIPRSVRAVLTSFGGYGVDGLDVETADTQIVGLAP